MKKSKYIQETPVSTRIVNSSVKSQITDKKEITFDKDSVIIYSNPFCYHCIRLKNMLEEKNLLKNVIIIEDDSIIPSYVKSKGYPFTKKGNDEYLGYPQSIDKYIERFF